MSNCIFTELLRLVCYEDGVNEYLETNRWIRYEEHLENWSHRWSQPHASTPDLQQVLRVKRLFLKTHFLMGVEADSLFGLIHHCCVELVKDKVLTLEEGRKLKHFLTTTRVRHHYEGPRVVPSKLMAVVNELFRNSKTADKVTRTNNPLKKIPPDVEATAIFEG